MDSLRQADNIFAKSFITVDPYLDIRAFAKVGNPDNSANLAKANARAVADGRGLYIPPQTFKIASNVNFTVPVRGEGATLSIIENTGVGDAVTFSGLPYHSACKDFGIKGNASSRDGLVLPTNTSYCQFNGIYSYGHGRHGLNHRASWATKYFNSKFFENGGIGALFDTQSGDPGTQNGVSLIQCEMRWNGGMSAGTTFADAKGGVVINGGTCFTIDDCIIESNNAWQILTGQNTYQSLQTLNILNSYIEGRPTASATVGGAFYFKYGGKIRVEGCEIGFGAGSGDTSYAYYIDGAAEVNERNNQYSAGGGGTSLYINAGGKLSRRLAPVVTKIMGDTGESGSPIARRLLTASNDGQYRLIGTIHCSRNSDQGGVYPFMAGRSTVGRYAQIGSPLVASALTAPTIAWNGNDLEITWGAYHMGHVEFSYTQINTPPTTFTLDATYIQSDRNIVNLPF